MTTNQTIDGVPRELLADFLQHRDNGDWYNGVWITHKDKLRALLDAPAEPKPTGLSQGWNLTRKHDGFVVGHQSAAYAPDAKAIERAERDGYVWVPFLLPSAQPQGEPVAWRWMQAHKNEWEYGSKLPVCVIGRWAPLYAEQPAPIAVAPVDYCIMPRQLTAENGAKALLLGEFKLMVTKECPECCELEEPTEGCSICDGEGEYGQKHTIPWDQIKYIYSKAVSGLAVKTGQTNPDRSTSVLHPQNL